MKNEKLSKKENAEPSRATERPHTGRYSHSLSPELSIRGCRPLDEHAAALLFKWLMTQLLGSEFLSL
jgi:hypothetical protein